MNPPKNRKATHPGVVYRTEFWPPIDSRPEMLRDLIRRAEGMGLTAGEFIKLCLGETGVDEIYAKKLARETFTSAEFWLNLQKNYDESGGG